MLQIDLSRLAVSLPSVLSCLGAITAAWLLSRVARPHTCKNEDQVRICATTGVIVFVLTLLFTYHTQVK